MDAITNVLPSVPRWIKPTFHRTPGMDPLGLQSITIDRIMPVLVPGILALSRRARYFSFYPFLIDELRRRDLSATQEDLSSFIKHREYELSLAVNLCPRCGGTATGAVGSSTTSPKVHRGDQEFPREESVKSFLGGYGLYYRTPMQVLGLVAPRGEYVPGRDVPLPRDHIRPGFAEELAELYRHSVVNTSYYREYFGGTQPIPRAVLEEFAEYGCLCRLDSHPVEQKLIQQALLEVQEVQHLNPFDSKLYENDTEQRRRSVGLLLWILGGGTGVSRVSEPLATFFRRTTGTEDSKYLSNESALAATLAQWSALTARDYMQEGLASIWSEICSMSLRLQPIDGMTREELNAFLQLSLLENSALVLGGVAISGEPHQLTEDFMSSVREGVAQMDLEELRDVVARSNTALSGLVLLLVLNERLSPEIMQRPAWRQVAAQRSNWQPGLIAFLEALREHLATSPQLSATISWMARRFVIDVHERNAFSKLPNYTFRFRWENGRLRFHDVEVDRMSLPDTRLDAVSTLGADLGLIRPDETGHSLTDRGWQYFREVLG
jgi:hypothetical protein